MLERCGRHEAHQTRTKLHREHSSAGRAHALQAWGHRFEPCCSHHPFGAVVQLVRTPACHAGGRGFKSLPRRQKGNDFILTLLFAQVAQLVEQRTENPRVAGSIPAGGTICECSSSGRAPPCQGGGSEFEPRHSLQRRHSQVVRQRSAKPLPPVQIWVAPPTKALSFDKAFFFCFPFHDLPVQRAKKEDTP